MTRRRVAWTAAVATVALAIPSSASAAWLAEGIDVGKARAFSVPTGPTSSVTDAGRSVHVTWAERTFGDGTAVAGYVVTRYDAANDPHPASGGCAGTVTALQCTEAETPPGTWRYAVRAVHAGWTGADGGLSATVTIAAPSLTWDSAATITALPTTLTGDVASFVAGETVAFRLDDPDTGTLLTGSTTPATIPANGQAGVSVAVPGGTADGMHDVFAVGDDGTVATATITVDRTAPVVTAATVAKSAGGIDGAIRQGGTYHVYANVADPVAGVASVAANLDAVTTGATAVNLVAGSYTIDGVSYGYRSAVQTADGVLAAGAKTFTVSATDAAGNSSSPASSTVTVDNTAPTAADVQATNGGATVGRPEIGDVVTFVWSEAMEPASLVTGWDGSATTVTVRIVNAAGRDQLEIWNAANTAQLASFGSVRLGSNGYVAATVSFTGSSAVLVGTTATITLGTPSGATATVAGNVQLRWTTATGATDVAGNAGTAANRNETGANDPDF